MRYLKYRMRREDREPSFLKCISELSGIKKIQQARKLQATLVRNDHPPSDSHTGVKCRATSVAKYMKQDNTKIQIAPQFLATGQHNIACTEGL